MKDTEAFTRDISDYQNSPIRKANPYRLLAKALKTGKVADNLLNRQFEDYGPRMVLLTDITSI